MVAIQYIGRAQGAAPSEPGELFMRAALAAQEAPSAGDLRPWRWRIDGDRAALVEDTRRRGPEDGDDRLVVIGCGASLHYALVTLAASGAGAAVHRLPDAQDPGLLAVVRYTGPVPHRRRADRLLRAIALRRTDRRSFAGVPLGPDCAALLRAAAERAGAVLQPVSGVTGRPDRYIVETAGESRRDWLATGEATSAVLLAAAAAGLVTSVEQFAPAVVLGLGIADRLGARD